jgi:hypothetical protein
MQLENLPRFIFFFARVGADEFSRRSSDKEKISNTGRAAVATGLAKQLAGWGRGRRRHGRALLTPRAADTGPVRR